MRKNYMKNGEIREGDSLHFDGKGYYTKKKRSGVGYIIAVILVLLIAGIFFGKFVAGAAPVERTSPTGYDYTCPEGQEPIGAGACRITPTGCPFGDSVPMEKCAPPPDIKCNADWSKCEPRTPEKKPAKSTVKPTPVVGSSCGK